MRYADLTYEEVSACARDGWLAAVPMGCTEQQGPHLAVGFDTWCAQELLEAASDRAAEAHGVRSLVLPALPFGPTPEHRSYGSGYVDLPAPTHNAVLEAILTSLADQRFPRIAVWRVCGGHDLVTAVDRFNERCARRTHVSLPVQPFHEIWCRVADPSVPGGHADSFTTSIALYRHPETVRLDRIPREPSGTDIDWDDPALDFARYSENGVIGDPRHASAELGRVLWDESVSSVAATIAALGEPPPKPG